MVGDEALVIGPGNVHIAAWLAIARVVDEQVDVKPLRTHRVGNARRRIRLSQVGDNHVRCDPVLLVELPGQFVEAITAASGQDETVALRRQQLSEGLADACRCAGDERRLAVPFSCPVSVEV